MSETVLIVDDEDSVRRTFQEWLTALPVRVLVAVDAEAALKAANAEPIDLAILDWNLGSGSDGLQLLEDLAEFQPDVVAILVTGYAAQATPLDALRKGVRDYLDKNHDLNRETFLAAVRKQLATIAPAKRQRALNASLAKFRDAVEQALPLVQGAATLSDPVPVTQAIASLMRFAVRATGAKAAALIVHAPAGTKVYDANGAPLATGDVAFSRTLAASAASLGEPRLTQDVNAEGVTLFPFETGRTSVLAVPLSVDDAQAVLELFDKAFTEADRHTASLVADIGSELLRHALAERRTQRLLSDALDAALAASRDVTGTADMMTAIRSGLDDRVVDAGLGLDLVAAVRDLAVRHGTGAVAHCLTLVRSLNTLLDAAT